MEGSPHSSRMPEERRSTSHKEARRRVARSPMPGQKSGSARWLRGIKSARPERAAIELNFNGRTVAMPDPGYSDLLITRTGAPRSKIVPASIAASGSALPGHRLAETLPFCCRPGMWLPRSRSPSRIAGQSAFLSAGTRLHWPSSSVGSRSGSQVGIASAGGVARQEPKALKVADKIASMGCKKRKRLEDPEENKIERPETTPFPGPIMALKQGGSSL